jgi:hypothetical protein
MPESGKSDLGSFALYMDRPMWVKGKPSKGNVEQLVWSKTGPEETSITALREGFIIFEFDKSKEYAGGVVPAYRLGADRKIPQNVRNADESRMNLAYRRFTYMNAFLCALYSAISIVQKTGTSVQEPINPANYFKAKKFGEDWKIITDGRQLDRPIERGVLEESSLDYAVNILNKLYDTMGTSSYDILSLIYQACWHYRNHQFSSAHVMAWTTIEVFLNDAWKKLQDEKDKNKGGHTAISKDRRKLLNGRDYTASIISQMLSLSGIIDDEILERLDDARRKRNDFAHNLELIDSRSAGKAIRLATDMVTKTIDVQVTSQLSLSYWGI